jgi:DNA-binding MarR family transcriptional regulator
VDLEPLGQRLATGLARVAVAVHLADGAGGSAEPIERTLSQQQVLLMLYRRREVYPLAELAQDLGMDRSDILAAVSTLAKDGQVQTQPNPSYRPDDLGIRLTEAGGRQPFDIQNWAANLMATLHTLTDEDQRQLLGLVTGHIRDLQDTGAIPVTRMCVTCRFFDGHRHAGSDLPHHCWLVDKPFGYRELRLRCPEAQPIVAPRQQVGSPQNEGRHRRSDS